MKILLAEDEQPAIEAVELLMEIWQYELEEVSNGKAAVERVKERSYDLVLMDLVMPVMDGYEAIRRIRNLKLNRYQPVLALSATESAGESVKAGADDFLEKPYDCGALHGKILELTPKIICVKMRGERLILEEKMPRAQSGFLRLRELRKAGREFVELADTGETLVIPQAGGFLSAGQAATEILTQLQKHCKTPFLPLAG